jgi:actin-related protein
MFDGFKIKIIDQLTISKLHNNWRLEFIAHVNSVTGEVVGQTAKYKGLKIETYPSGLIQIKGSFHKFYNDGLHNYDDFTINKLAEVINSLEMELDLAPQLASIHNLEFGVNINTAFAPNLFLNDILCFKWKSFNDMAIKGQGMGKICISLDQYLVKLYNKGLQFGRQQNILRIEKKIVAMCALKFGAIYLSDLTNPCLWKHCEDLLLEMFANILINEPININSITKNEQRIYHLVINQSNWSSFDSVRKMRYKKIFNNIISLHGSRKYQPTILKLIKDKCIELRA